MQKIAIIIPCYNEEKRLNLENIQSLIDNSNVDLYFANDGSKDNTINVLTEINCMFPGRTNILDYQVNQGKAHTIYKALNEINKKETYDYIGYFDADFSTPSEELINMINDLIKNKYQLIFASRVQLLNSGIERKWQRHVIGRVLITFINLKFRLGIYDTQCGAKVFSKTIINEIFDAPFQTSWLFDVEIFIRLKNNNLLKTGKEFPIQNWKDVEGSKLSWKSSFKIFKEIIYLINKY